jgi:hypothetical protein
MRAKIVSAVRWTVAAVLLVLFFVGLALPVIPQVPFLIGAFIVIAPESRWVRRKYISFRERHPKLFHPIESWRIEQRRKRRQVAGAPPATPGEGPGPSGPAGPGAAGRASVVLAAALAIHHSVFGIPR